MSSKITEETDKTCVRQTGSFQSDSHLYGSIYLHDQKSTKQKSIIDVNFMNAPQLCHTATSYTRYPASPLTLHLHRLSLYESLSSMQLQLWACLHPLANHHKKKREMAPTKSISTLNLKIES